MDRLEAVLAAAWDVVRRRVAFQRYMTCGVAVRHPSGRQDTVDLMEVWEADASGRLCVTIMLFERR
jgi:hypothetical protein